uniref:(northern house mosquito) hypothetical protein n=1 Tax=Culex pipiens TaxID=7175 RepID=A0A8D8EYG2_CULPI
MVFTHFVEIRCMVKSAVGNRQKKFADSSRAPRQTCPSLTVILVPAERNRNFCAEVTTLIPEKSCLCAEDGGHHVSDNLGFRNDRGGGGGSWGGQENSRY